MQTDVNERARRWLDPVFDADTRTRVKELLDEGGAELTECFYRNLEFGTGGLRGLMGVGTNR
ncbi:MAG: phospho-sugar mutase, partial [Bacteroidales bacterium]